MSKALTPRPKQTSKIAIKDISPKIPINLKDNYTIKITPTSANKYKTLCTKNIPLFSHQELPSDLEYIYPRLSLDEKWLGAIGKGPVYDTVFIWSTDDLYCYKYTYSKLKVDAFTFCPDNESFILIYKEASPAVYSLKDGKKLVDLEDNGDREKEGCRYSFSSKGRYFGYSTLNFFTIWHLKTGKIFKLIKNSSPIKLMCREFLVFVDKNFEGKIINYKDQNVLKTFKLKGLVNLKEILDIKADPNMNYLMYVIKEGIIQYNFESDEHVGILRFKKGVVKAQISDDCRYVIKSNMRNLSFFNVEERNYSGTVLNEKFKCFYVDFNSQKILKIDDISINVHDYANVREPEKFVWLNKNPSKFLHFSYSKNYKILLGTLDENNAVAYDIDTGKVIRKWKNPDDDWSMACEIVPEGKVKYSAIMTRCDNNLMKMWNFHNAREMASFYGYDCHSFSFSKNGKYLACGAQNGTEIARIWDLYNGKFKSFFHNGSNNNCYTIVNLTEDIPKNNVEPKLICASIGQSPVVFSTATQSALYECQCPMTFEKVYDIKSSSFCDVFIVKGRNTLKQDMAILYALTDGKLMKVFEDCWNIDITPNKDAILVKCKDINDGKLTIIHLEHINEPASYINCELKANMSNFLKDYQAIVSAFGNDKSVDFMLNDVADGKSLCKIEFLKKGKGHAEVDLSAGQKEGELVFRYAEFVCFEDYLKVKKISGYDRVDEKYLKKKERKEKGLKTEDDNEFFEKVPVLNCGC